MKFNVQITRVKKADEEAWIVVEATSEDDAYSRVKDMIHAANDPEHSHRAGLANVAKPVIEADWDEVYSQEEYQDASVGECLDA